MDHNQIFIIFLFVALIILSIGVIAILSLSKKLLISFQNTSVDIIKNKIFKVLREKNYNIKSTDKKIHVEKSNFKALNLLFKQNGNNVDVYWEVSQSRKGGIFIIITILIFGVSLILWQLADLKAKELKREILPILEENK